MKKQKKKKKKKKKQKKKQKKKKKSQANGTNQEAQQPEVASSLEGEKLIVNVNVAVATKGDEEITAPQVGGEPE